MLLSFWGKRAGQRRIAEAAGLTETIKKFGSKPSDLAKAVKKLYPEMRVWYKQGASIADLEVVVNQLEIPVMVEWQGLFYQTPEEELINGKKGSGHYGIIVYMDVEQDKIGMVDPYKDFYRQDRLFGLRWFEGRWWDYNLIKHRWRKQKRTMILVAPKDMHGFAKIGMKYFV